MNTGVPSTGGSASNAVLSIVPALTICWASTGRAPPCSHRFWPSSVYRYSCHSRAAAGCGASLLIACT